MIQLRDTDTVPPPSRSFRTAVRFRHSNQNQSYVHCPSTRPLLYRNIGQHLRLATEKFPNREALVSCHENKRFTFSDVLEKADRLAAGLQQLGLKGGDRVGIWDHNGSTSYLTSLAVARAGMILVFMLTIENKCDRNRFFCMKDF